MPKYEINCPDGTDRGCYGTVEVFIAKTMDESEVEAYVEDNDIPVDVCAACGSDYTRGPDGEILDE